MSSELNNNNEGNSFEYRLREMSDDEIISILRYRKHFNPNAVNGAIKEALKRSIISSVDDLDSDEFKPQELPPRSFFPLGSSLGQNLALLKSLCRIFYALGIIPLIYSYFQFTSKHAGMAILSMFTGIGILVLANRLEKKQKSIFSFILLSVNALAVGFALFSLHASGKPKMMDVAAALIILLVIMYTTLYAHKLARFIEKESMSDRSGK